MSFKFKDFESSRVIELNSGDTIGRSEANHCFPECPNMSRSHVQFVLVRNVAYVVDMGSRNGTYVNTVKMESNGRALLEHGHIIAFGGKTFIYSQEG